MLVDDPSKRKQSALAEDGTVADRVIYYASLLREESRVVYAKLNEATSLIGLAHEALESEDPEERRSAANLTRAWLLRQRGEVGDDYLSATVGVQAGAPADCEHIVALDQDLTARCVRCGEVVPSTTAPWEEAQGG